MARKQRRGRGGGGARGRGRGRGGRGGGRGRGAAVTTATRAPGPTAASGANTDEGETARTEETFAHAASSTAPPSSAQAAAKRTRLLARIARYRELCAQGDAGAASVPQWDSDDEGDDGGGDVAVAAQAAPARPMRRPDKRTPDIGTLFGMGAKVPAGGAVAPAPARSDASTAQSARDAQRARLRAKIAAKRRARAGAGADDAVYNERGRRVRGARRGDMPTSIDEAAAMLGPLGVSHDELMSRVQQRMAATGGAGAMAVASE